MAAPAGSRVVEGGAQSRTVNASVFNIQTEPYVPATTTPKAMSLDRVPT